MTMANQPIACPLVSPGPGFDMGKPTASPMSPNPNPSNPSFGIDLGFRAQMNANDLLQKLVCDCRSLITGDENWGKKGEIFNPYFFEKKLGKKRRRDTEITNCEDVEEMGGKKRKMKTELITTCADGELKLGKKSKVNPNSEVISTCESDDFEKAKLGKKSKMNPNEETVISDSELGLGERRVNMKIVCGSCYLPKHKPETPNFRGEDAHFVYDEGQILGVADGVGGWAKRGVDSSMYARQHMNNAKDEVVSHITGGAPAVDPVKVKVLSEAYQRNLLLQLHGSSAACILSFDKQRGSLHVVNVGDSGFMLFRDGKFRFQSETPRRKFNSPCSLGNYAHSERPESADAYEIEGFMAGDIIVLGTDGLFDNTFPNAVEELVLRSRSLEDAIGGDLDCQYLSMILVERARTNSYQQDYVSPFSVEANKAGIQWSGGKIDDVCSPCCGSFIATN